MIEIVLALLVLTEVWVFEVETTFKSTLLLLLLLLFWLLLILAKNRNYETPNKEILNLTYEKNAPGI